MVGIVAGGEAWSRNASQKSSSSSRLSPSGVVGGKLGPLDRPVTSDGRIIRESESAFRQQAREWPPFPRGSRERVEHLRRLAVVFAVPIRLKIVTELYQREMSPTQFFGEFGGGSVPRGARHFDRLRETGWLRQMWTEGPGGERQGATETIYRATELAFCDRPTYAALPHSLRIAVSWNGFKEIAELFRGALEASTLQSRPDRRLTGTQLLLDQEGWARVADAVAREFAEQYEEQEDARRRADRSGEELFRIGSLLLAFELPIRDGFRFGPDLAQGGELMVPFRVRVSKVFEDEVCLQIMDEANRRDISVPAFHAKYGKRFDLSKNMIRVRFAKLVQYGWLKVVRYESGGARRGGTEKFYGATGPAVYDEDERGPWARVPDALAETDDWRTFAQLSDWVKAATVAGTLTRHDETCLAWSMRFDDPGDLHRRTRRLHHHLVGGVEALGEELQGGALALHPARRANLSLLADRHLAEALVDVECKRAHLLPPSIGIDLVEADGQTTTTDSRSRRNWVGRRGGHIGFRAHSPYGRSGLPVSFASGSPGSSQPKLDSGPDVLPGRSFIPVGLSTTLVSPTSSNARPATFRAAISLDGTETRILAEQTTVVDLQRLGNSAGRLNADELRAVDEALALVLGL